MDQQVLQKAQLLQQKWNCCTTIDKLYHRSDRCTNNMHMTVLCLLLTNNQQKDRLYIYWTPARPYITVTSMHLRQEATENWQQCGEDYILPSLRQNWDSHNLQWTKGNANCIQTDCWACRVEMFLSLQKKKRSRTACSLQAGSMSHTNLTKDKINEKQHDKDNDMLSACYCY